MGLRATRAEISVPNFYANLAYFGSHLRQRGTRLCLAVKADAYGHGLVDLSWRAQAKVDAFAVATLDEAANLRHSGISKPILLMTPHLRDEIPQICELGLELLVSHGNYLADYQREASRYGLYLRLHLKVDTGMGQGGVIYSEALDLASQILAYDKLELFGLCSHFATADASDEMSCADTQAQLQCFRSVVQQFRKQGIVLPCLHVANPAATLQYPESHFDMVRIGIGAYGYCYEAPELLLVLSLKSKIGLIKKILAGHKVSYGGTWQAQRETLLALLPLGYADGYSRLLSNQGRALLGGELCPLVGWVCMDQMVLDISDFALKYPELGAEQLLEQYLELFGPPARPPQPKILQNKSAVFPMRYSPL